MNTSIMIHTSITLSDLKNIRCQSVYVYVSVQGIFFLNGIRAKISIIRLHKYINPELNGFSTLLSEYLPLLMISDYNDSGFIIYTHQLFCSLVYDTATCC